MTVESSSEVGSDGAGLLGGRRCGEIDQGSGRTCGRGWSAAGDAEVTDGAGEECTVRGVCSGELGDSWLVADGGEEGWAGNGEVSGRGLRTCSGGSSGLSRPGVVKVAMVGGGRRVAWEGSSESSSEDVEVDVMRSEV